MTFERSLGIVSVVLTAVAVSDKAEELYKRFQKHRRDRIEAQEARDQAFLQAEEAEVQRRWLEIVPDLR